MLLESGHQSSGHIRQIGLEEIGHTAHGVFQQATALFHLNGWSQLGISRMLCQALPDHGPEGVADERSHADRFGGAFTDVDLTDDGGQPGKVQGQANVDG
eukprot:Skav211442  [mRNA]  locus=scaffold1591:278619:279700:+ [translate_table: standard]